MKDFLKNSSAAGNADPVFQAKTRVLLAGVALANKMARGI